MDSSNFGHLVKNFVGFVSAAKSPLGRPHETNKKLQWRVELHGGGGGRERERIIAMHDFHVNTPRALAPKIPDPGMTQDVRGAP